MSDLRVARRDLDSGTRHVSCPTGALSGLLPEQTSPGAGSRRTDPHDDLGRELLPIRILLGGGGLRNFRREGIAG